MGRCFFVGPFVAAEGWTVGGAYGGGVVFRWLGKMAEVWERDLQAGSCFWLGLGRGSYTVGRVTKIFASWVVGWDISRSSRLAGFAAGPLKLKTSP